MRYFTFFVLLYQVFEIQCVILPLKHTSIRTVNFCKKFLYLDFINFRVASITIK